MTDKEQVNLLYSRLSAVLIHTAKEFEINPVTVVGVLDILKTEYTIVTNRALLKLPPPIEPPPSQ